MSPTARGTRFEISSTSGLITLAAIWALLWAAAYPWANFWLAAHLAPAPLILLAVRGRRGAKRGLVVYLVGVTWWLVMLSWLTEVTVPGYVALCLYLGLYPLLFVVLLDRLTRRGAVPLVVSAPMIWVGLEYLRGSVALTGFPWFLLGHSQPAGLIQIADFAGAYGVSFVVAMTSGMIMDLLTRPLVSRRSGQSRITWGVRLSVVLWAAALGGTAGYGIYRDNQYQTIRMQDSDRALAVVAVVQTDMPQSNKVSPTEEQDRIDFDAALTLSRAALADHRAGSGRVDLVVWPETMVPQALNDESMSLYRRLGLDHYAAYRHEIEQFARDHRVAMLIGGRAVLNWTPLNEGTADEVWQPGPRYNSAYLFDQQGALVDRFDKIHRVVFGEYVPNWLGLKALLRAFTPYDHDYSLTAGTRHTRFEITSADSGQPVGFATPICFEDVVSHVCRRMAYEGGEKRIDLLVNLTNDGWYPGSAQGWQHEQIARFRCVENRLPMARAVNRGVSGFIDSTGRVAGRVEVEGVAQQVAGSAVWSVPPDPRTTLFGRYGDLPAAFCFVFLILWLAAAVVRRFLGSPGR